MYPMSASGTEFTAQVRDRSIGMPSSVLEFSVWDARCKQIADLVLTEAHIEALRPWLKKQGCPWRIGWKRKPTKTKSKKTDPRQGNLF
jgi:hypothetical protein